MCPLHAYVVHEQKVPALLGILILELKKFCPGGCVSSGVARSGLAYSLNKREASDSNWSVGWDKHANCKQTPQTHKQTYIYTDTRNIYI